MTRSLLELCKLKPVIWGKEGTIIPHQFLYKSFSQKMKKNQLTMFLKGTLLFRPCDIKPFLGPQIGYSNTSSFKPYIM